MWRPFQPEMMGYAALGAFALWIRLKYGPAMLQGIEKFVDEIADDFRLRVFIKLAIFVTLGTALSDLLVEPHTSKQALAGGMAWTALFANMATAGTRKPKTDKAASNVKAAQE